MVNKTTADAVCLIYITAADHAEAMTIGRDLVGRRLAACANVIAPTTAIYRWEDKVCEDEEATLIVKTNRGRVDDVTSAVRALHSYELPCILILSDVTAETEFGNWLIRESQPAA